MKNIQFTLVYTIHTQFFCISFSVFFYFFSFIYYAAGYFYLIISFIYVLFYIYSILIAPLFCIFLFCSFHLPCSGRFLYNYSLPLVIPGSDKSSYTVFQNNSRSYPHLVRFFLPVS